jgi:hypothetical protein
MPKFPFLFLFMKNLSDSDLKFSHEPQGTSPWKFHAFQTTIPTFPIGIPHRLRDEENEEV